MPVNNLVTIDSVKSRLVTVRGQTALLDRDVAALYGVETRIINQAVRNNPDKFPKGYVLEMTKPELEDLRSKILIANVSPKSRVLPKVFTERGLYMLATILKGERAVRTTLAIIDTYAQVREMARTMEALQSVKDGGDEQQTLLQRIGEKLAEIVSRNLKTDASETEIELNFAVVKIRHRFVHKGK